LAVTALRPVSATVLAVTLADPAGGPLPAWDPGAHIDVVLPNGLVRQYSLCGDPTDGTSYQVAVLRDPHSRGASAYVHSELSPGDRIEVRGPRNHFALVDAPHYAFVAGGIGITPIVPMITTLEARGAHWSLLYIGRARSSMAFLDDLERYGPRVTVLETGGCGRPELGKLLDARQPGAAVYACGPESLLAAVEHEAADWPPSTLHVERFVLRPDPLPAPAGAFEVHLTETGLTLTVPAEKSILDVVEEAGIQHPYSCREGTCGTCEVSIVSGEAEHRDSVLTPEEQQENTHMMICVSRARSGRIELAI
jgi:ferredoxin-NADP reductase